MKIKKNTQTIERFGIGTESQFTINTNAKAFSILSSGIYTDPISAIIRELASNAKDSHTQADKEDIPFEIHLPNNLEPWFGVKDNGIGLSDNDIQGELVPKMLEDENGEIVEEVDDEGNVQYMRTGGLYTTYFGSNKTDSNDFIGAWGLGSKTPFAYTNAFEVSSRHDGMMRIYSVFLNEEEIPSVALMSENPTVECNGVEIRITAKPEDFYLFKIKTSNILRWFPVYPTISGAVTFTFDKPAISNITGPGFNILQHRSRYNSDISVVQGGVEYTVQKNKFEDYLENDVYEFFRRISMVLFFQIGEIEVSVSREEIRYSKYNLEFISNKINDVFDKTVAALAAKVHENDTAWNNYISLNEGCNELFGLGFKKLNLFNAIQHDYIYSKLINPGWSVKWTRCHSVVKYTRNSKYVSGYRKHAECQYVYPDSKTRILIQGTKKSVTSRIKKYFIDNQNVETVILITKSNNLKIHIIDDKDSETASELPDLLEHLGSPVTISTDMLEKMQRPANSYSPARKITVYNVNYNDVGNTCLSSSNCLLEDFSLYFIVRNKSQVFDTDDVDVLAPKFNINHWFSARDNIVHMLKLINVECDTDYKIADVKAVGISSKKLVINSPNHINIFALFREKILGKYINAANLSNRVSCTEDNICWVREIDFLEKLFIELGEESLFKQIYSIFVRKHKELKNTDSNTIDFIRTMCNLLPSCKNVLDENPIPVLTMDQFAQVLTKYPLITRTNIKYTSDEDVKNIAEYINLIDHKGENT